MDKELAGVPTYALSRHCICSHRLALRQLMLICF